MEKLIEKGYNGYEEYLREINSIPPLTRSEEVDLILKAQKGDDEAKRKIIESNLAKTAKAALNLARHMNTTYLIEDIIQIANASLLPALKNFNPENGASFATYASYYNTRDVIRDYNKNYNNFNLPESVIRLNKKINEFIERYEIMPSLNDIYNYLIDNGEKVSEAQVINILEATFPIRHFDEEIGIDDGNHQTLCLYEIVPDKKVNLEDEIIKKEIHENLFSLLEYLPERTNEIIKIHFGFYPEYKTNAKGYVPYATIAKIYGISAERVKCIISNGIEKLKKINQEKHILTR